MKRVSALSRHVVVGDELVSAETKAATNLAELKAGNDRYVKGELICKGCANPEHRAA